MTSIALGGVAILAASPARAGHFLDTHAVDSGEIRYEDNTRYDGALSYAVGKWNNIAGVYFAADTSWTIADVTLRDVTGACAASWSGRTWPATEADPIEYNVCKLDSYGWNKKRMVVTYEFGHKVGLDDHNNLMYADTMMYHAVTPVVDFHSHDISDYVERGW